MSTGTLTKVPAKTAAEICKQVKLGDEARALLRPDLTPRQYLDQLVAKGLFVDAVRFLGFALPKREAVWWACVCTRDVAGTNAPPEAAAALREAEKWVSEQKDEIRWTAKAAGEAAGTEHPAGLAAMAAFWSGGNIAPPGLDAVPAPENLTALMAGGAVLTAGVVKDAHLAPEKYRRYVNLGIDVANGTNRWK